MMVMVQVGTILVKLKCLVMGGLPNREIPRAKRGITDETLGTIPVTRTMLVLITVTMATVVGAGVRQAVVVVGFMEAVGEREAVARAGVRETTVVAMGRDRVETAMGKGTGAGVRCRGKHKFIYRMIINIPGHAHSLGLFSR